MRVVVTGAAGMIGANLLRGLNAIGIASRTDRPQASIAASVAITVSPAPVTSNTSRACAGRR